jgi:hypothetical protein
VNYVKVDTPPGIDNWKPIIDSMKRGDYFVTSGEVLIPSWSMQGTGSQRTSVADVEWTFHRLRADSVKALPFLA